MGLKMPHSFSDHLQGKNLPKIITNVDFDKKRKSTFCNFNIPTDILTLSAYYVLTNLSLIKFFRPTKID